jgi:hypothetical protein
VVDVIRADKADEGRREAHRRTREEGRELKNAQVAQPNQLDHAEQ